MPSKWERLKIQKFLKALKEGRMKTLEEKKKERQERLQDPEEQVWDIWEDDTIVPWKPKDAPRAIPAPKRELPTHAESFNPPEEYLLDEKEKAAFEELDESERPLNFMPQKIDALRKVPLYENLVRENFERCLDLYMAPRMLKKKVNVVDPNSLIPELPSPADLRPFPTSVSIEFKFHTSCIRSIAVSPCGKFLASGDEQHNLIVWCVQSAKILRRYKLENEIIDKIEWCPSTKHCILSATNDELVYLLQPGLYGKKVAQATEELLTECERKYNIDATANDQKEKYCKWRFDKDSYGKKLLKISFGRCISKVVWHVKGDYFATLANNVQSTSQVLIHSISKNNSTRPFTQAKGIVQAISFHPTRPNFFVCTHMQVFQYNLQK